MTDPCASAVEYVTALPEGATYPKNKPDRKNNLSNNHSLTSDFLDHKNKAVIASSSGSLECWAKKPNSQTKKKQSNIEITNHKKC